jgi:hypothetical protein
MILAGKYEQLERVAEAAIAVNRARDTMSGKTVYLHRLIPGSLQGTEALKLALQYSLKFPGNGVVLDLIEEPDGIYVVTDDKPEHAALLDFLPAEIAGGKTVTPPSPPVPRRPVQRPGPVPSFPMVEPSGPGEFTQLFRPGVVAGPNAPAPFVAHSGLSKQESAGDVPSEFTKKFDAVRHADPLGQPFGAVPSQEQKEPGEFTRMFTTAPPLKPHYPGSAAQYPGSIEGPGVLPRSQENKQQGEYTSLFGKAGPLASSARDSGANFLNERSPVPLTPPASAPLPAGPSDYTVVVRGGKLPAASSPTTVDEREPTLKPVPTVALPELKAPSVKAPDVPKAQLEQPAISPTLLLIAVVLVAAMALIVFFVLRR